MTSVNPFIQDNAVFVVVDIETTGLDPVKDKILEVGIKVTDPMFNVLGEWSSLVREYGWRARLAGNEYVWSMHKESGLIDELDTLPGITHDEDSYSPVEVAQAAYNWLTKDMEIGGLVNNGFNSKPVVPMTGSSVHFDRAFLAAKMPRLHSAFSYRNIDVSTIKELCRMVNPELYRKIQEQLKQNSDNKAHRALKDVDATIAELRAYADSFLYIEYAHDLIGQDTLPGL